jgi:hypothetical protein
MGCPVAALSAREPGSARGADHPACGRDLTRDRRRSRTRPAGDVERRSRATGHRQRVTAAHGDFAAPIQAQRDIVIFDQRGVRLSERCTDSVHPPFRYQHPGRQSEYDTSTPPAWGRLAAETLPNSYYFEFRGFGHVVLSQQAGSTGSPACAMQVMARVH